MENHVFPTIGDTPVDRVRREDILHILTPLWADRRDTARKVHGRIREALEWCQAHGHVDHNVANEGISGAVPKQRPMTVHLRALPYREVPAALEAIDASSSAPLKDCLRFLVLTACRSGEARGARWDEVDLDAREWRIPAERMKTGVQHRVPLSEAAMEVLFFAESHRGASALLFSRPAHPGVPFNYYALSSVLRNTGLAARTTVHGFRSSFRDWCAETGQPREIAEAALAHVVTGVEGAYFRSDLLERRRAVMEAWGRYATANQAALRVTGGLEDRASA